MREQCVLSFRHDIWWGEEIQRNFSELPNLMWFCEGYFLPVRNPPISCSLLITKNVSVPLSRSAYFLADLQHSRRSRTLKGRKKTLKWECFISPQVASTRNTNSTGSFAPNCASLYLIWNLWGSCCSYGHKKDAPAESTRAILRSCRRRWMAVLGVVV